MSRESYLIKIENSEYLAAKRNCWWKCGKGIYTLKFSNHPDMLFACKMEKEREIGLH